MFHQVYSKRIVKLDIVLNINIYNLIIGHSFLIYLFRIGRIIILFAILRSSSPMFNEGLPAGGSEMENEAAWGPLKIIAGERYEKYLPYVFCLGRDMHGFPSSEKGQA